MVHRGQIDIWHFTRITASFHTIQAVPDTTTQMGSFALNPSVAAGETVVIMIHNSSRSRHPMREAGASGGAAKMKRHFSLCIDSKTQKANAFLKYLNKGYWPTQMWAHINILCAGEDADYTGHA